MKWWCHQLVVPSANWCCHVIFNVAPEKFDMYSLGDRLKTTFKLERVPIIKDGRIEIVYFQRTAPAEPLLLLTGMPTDSFLQVL